MFKKKSNIIFATFVFRRNKVWFALSFTKGTVKTVEPDAWPKIRLVDALMHYSGRDFLAFYFYSIFVW